MNIMIGNNDFIKNISETTFEKADYIRLTETDEQTGHEESPRIIESVEENNKSIKDLLRLHCV